MIFLSGLGIGAKRSISEIERVLGLVSSNSLNLVNPLLPNLTISFISDGKPLSESETTSKSLLTKTPT